VDDAGQRRTGRRHPDDLIYGKPEVSVILRQPEPPFVLEPFTLHDLAAQDGEGSLTTPHMPHALYFEILRRPPPLILPRSNAARQGGSGSLRMTQSSLSADP
jgi:hypothetical protein